MPNTEPMTATEMTRAVNDIKTGIAGLNSKLDRIPDWDDIMRLEQHRDTEQAKQDDLIKANETGVHRVDARINALMMAVIVSCLGTAGSIIATLAQ